MLKTSASFYTCASVCVVLCCVLHYSNSSTFVSLQHLHCMLHVKVNVLLCIALLALCNVYCSVNCIAQVIRCCTLANVLCASANCVVLCLCSIVQLQLHKCNSVRNIRFSCVKLIVVCFCSAVVLRLLLRVSVKQLCKHLFALCCLRCCCIVYNNVQCVLQAKKYTQTKKVLG
jgi:hypothetical protein